MMKLYIDFVCLQEYLSLPAGSWTFQARATDLAGNVEGTASPSRPSRTWTVALPASHAVITGRECLEDVCALAALRRSRCDLR